MIIVRSLEELKGYVRKGGDSSAFCSGIEVNKATVVIVGLLRSVITQFLSGDQEIKNNEPIPTA